MSSNLSGWRQWLIKMVAGKATIVLHAHLDCEHNDVPADNPAGYLMEANGMTPSGERKPDG